VVGASGEGWKWHYKKLFNIDRRRMLGMEKRVALLSIIVDEKDSVEKLNALLHEYGEFIIGRMGIPYKRREINIISIAMDAPQDTTSELAGKIGKLEGVNVKTSFSGVISNDE
jgi:hypothetical protein